MAEYIEREKLIARLKLSPLFLGADLVRDGVIDIVQKQPTADVVKVVRGRECRRFTTGYCCRDIKGRSQMHYMGENAFCSYGEKMDGKGESE